MTVPMLRALGRSGSVVARGFRTTAVRRGGEPKDGFEFVHAEYMYNLRNTPPNKIKIYSLIGGGVFLGCFIPIALVDFSQRKAGYPPLLSLSGYGKPKDE